MDEWIAARVMSSMSAEGIVSPLDAAPTNLPQHERNGLLSPSLSSRGGDENRLG